MSLLDPWIEYSTLLLLLNRWWHKNSGPVLGPACWGLILGARAFAMPGADMDATKLPPAMPAVQIEFARDIKPILEKSCFRCHGAGKTKGGFRLDSRPAALKGGDSGADIIPGESARSPLVFYVARLVDDMEMPPTGKGASLTRDQIGLLRTWIDQGVVWEKVEPKSTFDAEISPVIGGTVVQGDQAKFRELYWQRDGLNGGIERLELFEQRDAATSVLIKGHALANDYKVSLDLDRDAVGFVRAGWEQYRKYFDDSGGYDPQAAVSSPARLGTDLHLDIGKAWLDLGLKLPRGPKMVLGYEYDYLQGNEAITSWSGNGSGSDPRNVSPASKHLDQGTHIVKFDLDGEFHGIRLEDRFRGEFFRLSNAYTNGAARGAVTQVAREANRSFQGANSIHVEGKPREWLFGSAGYFYSKLNADGAFADVTLNNGTLFLASVSHIELSRESHVINLNGILGPFEGLTMSAGLQSEWTRQLGVGDGNLNGIGYARPPDVNFTISPATLAASYDKNTVSETAGLRYSKIPYTVLFVDGRLQQESIGQSDSDIQPTTSFVENPSFDSRNSEVRAGFNTSPWQSLSWSSHYRRYEDDSRYRTNQPPQPPGGYPGLIERREVVTDEVETRLVVRPLSWLKTTLTCRMIDTDYNQQTRSAYDGLTAFVFSPGGSLLAGRYEANVYSLGLAVTPRRPFSLYGTFTYQNTKTTTASSGIIPPYRGNVLSVLAGGSWILNPTTDLLLNYTISWGDYSQSNSPLALNSPPPIGIVYRQNGLQVSVNHRVNQRLTIRLQYGFYQYDEPTFGGANDFTAHSLFALLSYQIR